MGILSFISRYAREGTRKIKSQYAGGMFFARWRVLWFSDASGTDVDENQTSLQQVAPICAPSLIFCALRSTPKMATKGRHLRPCKPARELSIDMRPIFCYN